MRRRTILGTLPAGVIFVVLWLLSSMPTLPPPPLGFAWQDKVYHVVAFLGYGLSLRLLVWSWQWRWPIRSVLALGLLTAVLDEWHQSWIPGRESDVVDVAADMVGIALALAAWAACRAWPGGRRTTV